MRRKSLSLLAAGALGASGTFAAAAPAYAYGSYLPESETGGTTDTSGGTTLTYHISNSEVNQMWAAMTASTAFCYPLPEPFGAICSTVSGVPGEVEYAFVNGCDLIQRSYVYASGNSWEGSDTDLTAINCQDRSS